jgi:hypothetical protein
MVRGEVRLMRSFSLGKVKTSPAASAALAVAGRELEGFLARHQRGDWGDVDQRQRQYNDWASRHEAILSSTYRLDDDVALLVSTAADRPSTHVPQGYLPDTLTAQEDDAALCLIILAQKRALR